MSKSEAHPAAKAARVFIVDDHPLVREGLAALLAGQPDLVVCGEADDLAPALELLKAKKPDLVVVDRGTSTLRIYQGQVGGGYSSKPVYTLVLPAGAKASAVFAVG